MGKRSSLFQKKMAALEVVYKRLTSVALSDFCLTLHSHKANKKEILEQLRTSLNLSRKKAELNDEAFQQLDRLKANRDELNAYSDAIYAHIAPFNKSIYEVNGQLENLQKYDEVIFDVSDVANISVPAFNEYLYLLSKFADTIGKMTGDYKNNPWYGSNVHFVSHELHHDINAKLGVLIPQALNISRIFDDILGALSLSLPSTYANIENVISILKLASSSPIIPVFWIMGDDVEPLYQEIEKTQEMMNGLHSMMMQYNDVIGKAAELDGDVTFDTEPIQCTLDAKRHVDQINQITCNNPRYTKWSSFDNLSSVKTFCVAASEQALCCYTLKQDLLSEYETDILNIDFKGILSRFRTEYTSFLKIFKRQYKKDKKTVQARMKQFSKKIDDATVIDAITKLNNIHSIQHWFEENNANLNEYFPECNQGLDTDFDAIKAEFGIFSFIQTAINHIENIMGRLSQIEENENTLRQHYEFLYQGLSTDWNAIRRKLDWALTFKKAVSDYQLNQQFVQYICNDKAKIEVCAEYQSLLSQAFCELSPNYQWFSALFDADSVAMLSQLTMPQLSDHCERCVNGQFLLEEWIDFRSTREKCVEIRLKDYIEKVDQMNIDKSNIVPIFKKRFYRLWLDAVLPQYPAVMNFRRRSHEDTTREFSQLDVLQFDIAKARIQQRLISTLPSMDRFPNGGDELSLLKRELSKQRRIMPIRKLFKAIPNLLMALKPCLMMSPLSVSLFLEAESYSFDTVIFDEASQVCTENAIGTISRGKQVIIAGDSKQLPPTNFFAAATSDTDFDDDGAYESILDEASLLPERTLLWHYRSKHEHLIAFSNTKIYHNNLITFPSNTEKITNSGVEYIYVRDGTYDRGGKKGNAVEAEQVAELVFKHFKCFPNRSLGVIAFGGVQQQAIDMALRQMRVARQEFEPFLTKIKKKLFSLRTWEMYRAMKEILSFLALDMQNHRLVKCA